jgi:hypothetical protein
MIGQSATEMTGSSASRVLGRKMDSIPFSAYHVLIIFVLALVGFVEGYDLFMTGSLLVLAKGPLQLTETDNQWLLLGPAIMGTIGGFGFSAVGDQLSRKAMLVIGVIAAELMPAQHRRTYGAVYEMALASSFTVQSMRHGSPRQTARFDGSCADARKWGD